MAKNNLPKNGKEGKPFFYFYPADWETDYNLQNCSIAAQGLWIKLLCIMHGGTPRGYLSNQKKPLNDEVIRRRVGLDLDEYKKLLSELKEFGVIRSNECGYYSKRMVRDTEISEIRSKVKKNAWDIKKATIVKSQDDRKMVGDLQINEINGIKENLEIPHVEGESKKRMSSFQSQFLLFTMEELISILNDKLGWVKINWHDMFVGAFNNYPQTTYLEQAILHLIKSGIDKAFRATNPQRKLVELLAVGKNLTYLSKEEFMELLHAKGKHGKKADNDPQRWERLLKEAEEDDIREGRA